MKTFEDLEFGPHRMTNRTPEMEAFWRHTVELDRPYHPEIQARQKFDNGTYISVVGGGLFYGDGVETFEVMDTCTGGGVEGHLTKEQVTERMKALQELPPATPADSPPTSAQD